MAVWETGVVKAFPSKAVPAQQQLRRYMLGSFYVLYLMMPMMVAAFSLRMDLPARIAVPFLVLFALHCAACVLTMQIEVNHVVDGVPARSWPRILLAVTTVTTVAVALWAMRPADGGDLWPIWPAALILILAACAVTPIMSNLQAFWVSALIAVLAMSAAWWFGFWAELPAAARASALTISLGIPSFLVSVVMLYTGRWSVVLLRSVQDQANLDGMRADLAVAEERLRIARDLHDLLGRTLTAVALKSDLAAALADAGENQRAAEESRAIHDLADDSLADLRGVLAGYRKADLPTELAGARALLRSAGVETRIIGGNRVVPSAASEALSWVLREAATNIVRHSAATEATLKLHVEPNQATLTVTNDGVSRAAETQSSLAVTGGTAGSGLVGLRARLASIGGTLEVSRLGGGQFVVTANVPISTEAGESADD